MDQLFFHILGTKGTEEEHEPASSHTVFKYIIIGLTLERLCKYRNMTNEKIGGGGKERVQHPVVRSCW